MAQILPVSMKEAAQLQALGFEQGNIKLNTLSFESDAKICSHFMADGKAGVLICDLKKNFSVTKQTLAKAEAVIMHPTMNIMAVRAKNDTNAVIIQVYNLDQNKKIKDLTVNLDITFWRWLNNSTIGVVSTSSVLLISIDDQSSPAKKLFDRQGTMANQNVFVMNLTCDTNMQWFSLSGISSVKSQAGQPMVVGYIQLYNDSVKQSNLLEGFCSVYGNVRCVDEIPVSLVAFVMKKANVPQHLLVITDTSPQKRVKLQVEIPMASENDFPVLLNFVEDFGLLFLATNTGNLFIFEVSKGILIFRCKISEESLLFSAKNTMTGGMIYINKSGKVIFVDIDKNNFINFVMNYCKGVNNIMELCTSLAGRYNLPGAENIFTGLFKNYMQNGNFVEAAKICRDTPGDTLRNIETLNMFKSLQGSPPPILTYFQVMMEKGKLNHIESIEICKPVLAQGKTDVLHKWFNENKITSSEELSELVKTVDTNLSLKILMASGSSSAHGKIIEAFASSGQVDKIVPYCQQNGFSPDWVSLMKNIVAVNASGAAELAKTICNRQTGQMLIEVNQVIEIFCARKKIQELTQFMVVYLKSNLPDDAYLQTKILELNLYENQQAASVILNSNVFTHYDKLKIASICEKMSMYQVCLENYTDINDIKRIVVRTNVINPEYLINYFGKLTPENCLICLHELMHTNPLQNLNIVIESAVRYVQRIPLNELVKLFETYGNFNGLYLFLNKISRSIDNPEIMYKYICAGVVTNNVNEVSDVIRDFDNYDPKKVLDFFLEKKLVNPRPLIILCDKHDYIEQLTVYLFKNKLTKFLENYVFSRHQSTPRVIGTLIDEECDENYIKQILNTVRGSCPIEPLVEEVTKRHKVKLIQKFLEDRSDEGNQTPALYNALAMIYVETNNNAKDFLMNNKYFDPKIVGNYCEDRDPQLALLAYKKASGSCDDELIALTNKNAMYRAQAQYLVESLNPELWKKVLSAENEHKKAVTDQVIQVILPNTRNPEEVSITVKAFIEAGLQADLIDLLEKLVLHNNEFSKNKSLQNLLILTAITTEGKKVKGFLSRLEAYDGTDIAVKCLENNLSEEAFYIYDSKTKEFSKAIDVLIRYINDLKRATIYAEKINLPEVWGKLGRALLTHDIIDEAIEAFIKANDAEMYNEVINSAERQGKFDDLIRYLNMARTLKKDKFIDCELVYSLSRCNKLVELETLLGQSNISDLGTIGDRLFDEKFYEPAKIIYEHLGNNARLASCYVYLKNYSQAIVAAKKANTQKCWKEICFACIKAKEYRLAAQAGNSIIQVADIVEEVIKEYEKYGAYSELIALFESNLVGERNHIITELGVLYAKYLPQKLIDHCRNYYSNMNVPKVIRVCEQCYLWEEVVFLYSHYNGYDNALLTMIEHSPLCWKHDLYCQTLSKVTNSNLYSESIRFYMTEQPQLLNDMLKVISAKIDLSNAVYELRKVGGLTLAVPFLKSVQQANNIDVNEALNDIYVDEEDPESLKNSILDYSSFDQLSLAKRIENHTLLEFRRISALVYRKNKKYTESIEISKKLKFYKDAIDTALESGKEELTEYLLRFFASIGDKECFAACLYTCYEFVKPDVAMELSWRFNLNEFTMPYFIQTTRDMTKQMDHMQLKAEISEEKAKKEKEQSGEQILDINLNMGNNGLTVYGQAPNMGPYGMGMMGGMGMGGMGGMSGMSGY